MGSGLYHNSQEDAPGRLDFTEATDIPKKAGSFVIPVSQMKKLRLKEKEELISAEEAHPESGPGQAVLKAYFMQKPREWAGGGGVLPG